MCAFSYRHMQQRGREAGTCNFFTTTNTCHRFDEYGPTCVQQKDALHLKRWIIIIGEIKKINKPRAIRFQQQKNVFPANTKRTTKRKRKRNEWWFILSIVKQTAIKAKSNDPWVILACLNIRWVSKHPFHTNIKYFEDKCTHHFWIIFASFWISERNIWWLKMRQTKG